MKISIILCTYNRCQSLSKALNSVAGSSLPAGVDWEVLVVDNNSSDETRRLVEEFTWRYPGRFRYLFEPQPGKSHALNTGIRESTAEVLAFMDDDVIVGPTWLQNLTASLNDSTWSGTGGRILAPEDFRPPRWLAVDGPYGFGAMLCAHFDLGEQALELDRAPYGTNMAFKRAMFEKYGGFRTDLGPRPGSEMRNEDTEFARRLFAGGERLRYEPAAIVRHAVPEKRVNKEFLLDWEFEYGKGKMREAGRKPEILGVPRYWFSIPKGIAKILLLTLQWLVAVNPQRRFFLKASVWYMAGEVTETFAQARRNDGPSVAALS